MLMKTYSVMYLYIYVAYAFQTLFLSGKFSETTPHTPHHPIKARAKPNFQYAIVAFSTNIACFVCVRMYAIYKYTCIYFHEVLMKFYAGASIVIIGTTARNIYS